VKRYAQLRDTCAVFDFAAPQNLAARFVFAAVGQEYREPEHVPCRPERLLWSRMRYRRKALAVLLVLKTLDDGGAGLPSFTVFRISLLDIGGELIA
jgi:hypothetical protein